MFSSNKISQTNLNSNIPYRPATAHAIHSFCIQARQTISPMFSIATTFVHCSHPLHNSLPMHININNPPLPTTLPSTTLLCTPLTDTKHICVAKWRQNGTRCRDGVKVWYHSHLVWLVFEGSIFTCACFHSENFL